MIEYSIVPVENLFNKEFRLTWRNQIVKHIDTPTGKKPNVGFFCAPTLPECTCRLKLVIKQQTAIILTSIAKERSHAYSYWTPTTTKDQQIKFEYQKLVEKLIVFANDCNKKPFTMLMFDTVKLTDTTLRTLTPHIGSSKHESFKNKVYSIHFFCANIIEQIEQLLSEKAMSF
ncbi:MAG: hypothetical protein WCQ95_01440 [Bacteroidota bacterium]